MSEVIVVSPQLQSAAEKIGRQKCLAAYAGLVESLSSLPPDVLVRGAIEYEKQVQESGVPDVTGNTWIQALSVKDPELALSAQEMIDSGEWK